MESHDLIMITTHQDDLNIYKLLDSVKNNIIDNIKVLIIIISQECTINYSSQNSWLKTHFIHEEKMGLSKARNLALKYLLNNAISAEYIFLTSSSNNF